MKKTTKKFSEFIKLIKMETLNELGNLIFIFMYKTTHTQETKPTTSNNTKSITLN